jgi:hypothetical protein
VVSGRVGVGKERGSPCSSLTTAGAILAVRWDCESLSVVECRDGEERCQNPGRVPLEGGRVIRWVVLLEFEVRLLYSTLRMRRTDVQVHATLTLALPCGLEASQPYTSTTRLPSATFRDFLTLLLPHLLPIPSMSSADLLQVWEAAKASPYQPFIGKSSQFLAGSTLLIVGM